MIDINWLTVVLGTLLPMLTALATARLASGGVKAAVLALLSAVGGLGNELYSVHGVLAGFDWSQGLANAVTVFLIGVGLHYGLLKPVGITGSEGGIQRSVTGGIGSDRPEHAAS